MQGRRQVDHEGEEEDLQMRSVLLDTASDALASAAVAAGLDRSGPRRGSPEWPVATLHEAPDRDRQAA